jgi:hypothetical protein
MSDLNPKQELYLAYLFDGESETRGDSLASCIAAGYSRDYHSALLRTLREDIKMRTIDSLSSRAAKAVMQLEASLDEDGSTPRGEIRLKAAESILDRMGAGKAQAIDITSKDESISPLFVLPAKDTDITVEDKYDNINLNHD